MRRQGPVTLVGGGLAGSEAALQLAARGHSVQLFEMRPTRSTEAHKSADLAEIVCSNSFKSERDDTASGVLKLELDLLGCRLLDFARRARVPAGAALAMDRERFSGAVTRALLESPQVKVVREEVQRIPEARPCILATGPLTSPSLQEDLGHLLGEEALYFYDAIAPSVLLDSIDSEIAFKAARYEKGDADYYNCPLNKEEYERFVDELLAAERVQPKDFEKAAYFQGCMPIEAIAEGGRESLRFGPMRPVGLRDPRTGRRPWAVVQLRQETMDGTLLGLVGFQTQLKYPEQRRIFSMIPGLEHAEFVRLGSLHRNTFIHSAKHLDERLQLRGQEGLHLAGQMIGCEGYVESIATGLVASLALHAAARELPFAPPPKETILGSLLAYLREDTGQRPSPMNVNFGLLPPLREKIRDKRARKQALARRAVSAMASWRAEFAPLFS